MSNSSTLIFDPVETEQADLRGGITPWRRNMVHRTRPPLDTDHQCDVVIVGAGITGALMAEHLTSYGYNVCVLDRERPGMGSTAASTSMLQWEIDRPLRDLTALYGFDRASAIYRRSLASASGLISLVRELNIACAMRPRHSIYLAAGEVGARPLLDEHELRAKANLPGEYIDRPRLARDFGFDREAALISPGSADADPLRLTHGLLEVAVSRGAQVFDGQAESYHSAGSGAAVVLDNDRVIEAKHIVLATGYVMPGLVQSRLHRMTSSWAIATTVQPPTSLWRDGMLIWEASHRYHYGRTTIQGRIIFGGEDDDNVVEPDLRDQQIPNKNNSLWNALTALWPDTRGDVAFGWSGAFGTTPDGLPLIGPVPGHSRIYAAYGYGGNGITFSYLASRMIARMIAGDHRNWFEDFSLERDG